jgi:hypothetical protein
MRQVVLDCNAASLGDVVVTGVDTRITNDPG